MHFLVYLAKKLNIIPVPFVDTHPAICFARALLEANKLGLFVALEKRSEGMTAEQVAEEIGISAAGAKVLLSALATEAYVTRLKNGRFTNGRVTKRWILGERGLSNYLHVELNMWDRLTQLEPVLRTGNPVQDHNRLFGQTPSRLQEIYTLSMRETARLLIPSFIRKITIPKTAKRLLDIGGAHGDFSRAVARRYPGLKATIFDFAGPIETAKGIIAKEGNAEGLELQVGDASCDDFGSGWDVVLLLQTIHCITPEQNLSLFARVHKALNSGGVLIIMDQLQGGRTGLFNSIASLLNVTMFTQGGRSYHRDEVIDMCSRAGFSTIKVKPILFKAPTTIVEAWK